MKKDSSKKKKVKLTTSKKIEIATAIVLMCLWVAASVIAMQFITGIIMVSVLGKELMSQPIWIAIYSALSYVLAGGLIIFVPAKFFKKWLKDKVKIDTSDLDVSRTDLGLKGWPTWTDIGFSPVGLIASLILAAGLVAIFSLFPWFDADQVQDVGFSVYISGIDRVIAFITLVVIAPIAEEIIFRGWLYSRVRGRLNNLPEWGGVVVSTLIVSVLFGALHGQWNVGVNVFCLSVVLCVMREITGTIYAGMLTHMLRNGLAFYLLYVLGIS